MSGFGDFNADELMASLEASSTPIVEGVTNNLLNPVMAQDNGAELDLDALLAQAEFPGGAAPKRAIPVIDQTVRPSKPAKLVRVESKTGRPEEIFHTVRKKNPKGAKTLQVGNYQLGAKLGRGAFGAVFKALDLKTGKFVALKRIGLDKIDPDQMMKEINFLKQFEHKNIVKYLGMVKTEQHLNLVLEFVDSGSLSQVLAGYGFFPESLAAIYISQVLEGLSYLHSKKVIHRDIKGGNLLITREGYIKLADFGIATVVSNVQRHSLVEGSPYWMAPEIITQSHPSTTASDIWSIGCTLVELLTGYPPYFEMVAMSAIYKMVNDGCPPLPDDITDNAADFLRKCFIFNPDERPSAQDLRNHPWILEHVPEFESVPDLDEVREAVQKFTLSKEQGLQISKDLKSMSFDDDSDTGTESPYPSPLPTDDKRAKPTRKAKRKDTDDVEGDYELVDSTGTRRKKKTKKGTLGKFRKKKEKVSAADAIIPSSDASLMVVNIYGVETRRSIFAFTVFKIKVMQDARVWDIERTWSDFKEMHTRLETEFGPDDLPQLSARKFWGVLDSDFVRKRWQELQHYLVELMKSKKIRDSNSFLSFLTAKS